MQIQSLLVASAMAVASPLAAQIVPPGHDVGLRHRHAANPYSYRGCAVDLLGHDIYGALDHRVVRIDEQGKLHDVLVLPQGHSIGLVARPRRAVEVFFTHAEQRRIYRRHLYTAAQSSGPVPHQAFDLELAPTGELLVSANPTWPAPGNRSGIWLVDLALGNHREIVQLSGPSGPLCFDAAGNLLYALQSATYPTPPGAVRILRFAAADVAAAVAGRRTLTLADAQTVLAGLDGAYDLEIDDRGRLYVSDPQHGDVRRTRPDLGPLEPTPFVARPAPPLQRGVLNLQFVDLPATTFDAWQPAGSGALFLCSSDWAFASEVHEVRTRRPEFVASPGTTLPPGPVRLGARLAPPNAPALLLVSAAGPVPEWSAGLVGGAPLWLGLSPSAPLGWVAGRSDGSGAATFDLTHPGGFAATLTAQVALIDFIAAQAGTTPATPLQLTR